MTRPDIWAQTKSGRAVDLLRPDPATIDFGDIAWHLAHINRYAGATRRPVSVAYHTLMGLTFCDESLAPYWLIHDAHEAYTGEIPSPMKRALAAGGGAGVGLIESALDGAICAAAGLPVEGMIAARESVARIDLRCLVTERRDFLSCSPRPWGAPIEAATPDHEIWRGDEWGVSPSDVAGSLARAFRRHLPALRTS